MRPKIVSVSRMNTVIESVVAGRDLLGVVREPRQQHARGLAVEERDRQVQVTVEDLGAQPS